MAQNDIPILVKKVALAIYDSGYAKGNKFQKISGALEIARNQLVRQGYLREGSQDGGPENIVLTAQGQKRESIHRRKSDTRMRVIEWDKLYALVQTAEEGQPGEGSTDEADAAPRRDTYQKRRKDRLAQSAKRAPTPKPRKRTRRMRRAKKAPRG
jgi:hypothetical protein